MPHYTLALTPEQEALLMSKIDAGGVCWEWTSGCFSSGYGVFHVCRKAYRAHRVVYEWLVGPIPKDLQPDHLCRNRKCVNPDHIELVTAKVNTLRSNNPAANNARRTSCVNGHALVESNVYRTRDGRRQCRACIKLRAEKHKMKGSG